MPKSQENKLAPVGIAGRVKNFLLNFLWAFIWLLEAIAGFWRKLFLRKDEK